MNLTTVVVDMDSIVLKAYNYTLNPKNRVIPPLWICTFKACSEHNSKTAKGDEWNLVHW